MLQLPTNVDIPAAPRPVNYSEYGQTVGSAIDKGGALLGNIIRGFQQVEETKNKEQLKAGILSELQQKAPHVLKYMKPNPSFEDVARGAYQMTITDALYDQARAAIKPDPTTGKPRKTLAPKETIQQLAFATDDAGFQKMVQGFEQMIKDQDKAGIEQSNLEALRKGVAQPGTLEQKAAAAIQDTGFTGEAPAQGMEMFRMTGTKEATYLANEAKKLAAQAKADAEAAKLEYRQKADELKRRGDAAKLALAARKVKGDEMKNRKDAEQVNLEYAKQVEDINLNVAKMEQAVKDANKRRQTAQALMNQAKASMGSIEDPEAKKLYEGKFEAAAKLVQDIDDEITRYRSAAEDYAKTLKYTTDQQTIFVRDMKQDFGIDLITPTHEAANPNIRTGDLNFGEGLDGEPEPAPAPMNPEPAPAPGPGSALPSGAQEIKLPDGTVIKVKPKIK